MIRVLALIVHNQELMGYRFYDEETYKIWEEEIEESYDYLLDFVCSNIHLKNGILICTDGNINMIPILDYNTNKCIHNDYLALIGVIANGVYRVVDCTGKTKDILLDECLTLEKKVGFYNAKVVKRGGIDYIESNTDIRSTGKNGIIEIPIKNTEHVDGAFKSVWARISDFFFG